MSISETTYSVSYLDSAHIFSKAKQTSKQTHAGYVSTIAGLSGHPGAHDGAGEVAQFSAPASLICLESGDVLVGDTGERALRVVHSSKVCDADLHGLKGIDLCWGHWQASAACCAHLRGMLCQESKSWNGTHASKRKARVLSDSQNSSNSSELESGLHAMHPFCCPKLLLAMKDECPW